MEYQIYNETAYNCKENIIVAVANFYKTDYEMMSLDAWNFFYEGKGGTKIGKKVGNGAFTRYDYLKKYHGIQMKEIYPNNAEEALRIIKEELNSGNPIATYIDCYYCPWDFRNYKKRHRDHYCLVKEVFENKLILVDAILAREGKEICFEDYQKGFNSLILFEFNKPNELLNPIECLKKAILKNDNTPKCNFEAMENFIEDFKSIDLNLEVEDNVSDPYEAPIFQEIYLIGKRRKQFALVLNYFSRKQEDEMYSYLANEFNKVGELWNSVYGILTKLYIKQTEISLLKKAHEKLEDIIKREKKIYMDLLSVLNNNPIIIDEKRLPKIKDLRNMNLNAIYNNKAFSGKNGKRLAANFTFDGRYLIHNDKKFLINNCLYINEIDYFNQLDSDFDNIMCNRQEITLEKNCSSLIFIGCSVFGSHSERIELKLANNEIVSKVLELSNWAEQEPVYKDNIVWSGRGCISRGDNREIMYPFQFHLFSTQISFGEKCIKSIILPENEDMRIFMILYGN